MTESVTGTRFMSHITTKARRAMGTDLIALQGALVQSYGIREARPGNPGPAMPLACNAWPYWQRWEHDPLDSGSHILDSGSCLTLKTFDRIGDITKTILWLVWV